MAPASSFPIKVGHIHDVQELMQANEPHVPERFIRNKVETQASATTASNIPVVDLSKLLNGDETEFQSEMLKLSASCEEWGFFQVINHGIDEEVLSDIEKVAMEFFMLPAEEKRKRPIAPGMIQGYGQAFVFSEEQKLDWCNMLALAIEPFSFRDLSLWPIYPPTFSESLENYSREINKLCQSLLRFIAMTLSLNKNVFEEIFGEAVQAVRMNYYPPCPRPDDVNGLSPHSDGSGLTVLLQRKGSSAGLQILNNDTWVSVDPIPNALIINIGDTLEVLTNGKYKSVEHRAITHKEKDRLSIVSFYAPSYDKEIGPMPEMVDENNHANYKIYSQGEYSKHYVTNKLQGKKTLDFAKIHP
ncbi:protein LATERAL BRANCHING OXIDOREDUCTASE 1-like [Apium graveolens]|uniref:protein LATERAL BRANCHING OXIDOREDUCTASE 1-like n=1 Tax=Apium graveolens TaxID=4045 RepID=UPI003D79631B